VTTVRSISLVEFMSHERTHLELPNTGIVLVTGENGSGKSALVEGVATAFWGETLRGTLPWRAGMPGDAQVETDELVVTRSITKGGKKSLSWTRPPANAEEWESTTKAQEALERVVGSFDVWRRCSVFSSQDAAHFTLATDGERKRMLEEILGIDRFDAALTRCRADVAVNNGKVGKLEREAATLSAALDAAAQRTKDAAAALALEPEPQPVVDIEARRARAAASYKATRAALADTEALIEQLSSTGSDIAAEIRAAKARMEKLERARCGECGQAIPVELVEEQRKALVELRIRADAGTEMNAAMIADSRERVAELRADADELRTRIAEMDSALSISGEARKRRAHHQAAIGAAQRTWTQARLDAEKVAGNLAAAKVEGANLEAVEKVLGLRGVRAMLLGRSLSGIEDAANAWLDRIAGEGLRLHLKPYTEKKTGGTSEAISLEVEGAGGGYGYRAASAGQRRRIDVALLFALAEVAAAARGVAGGTLWIDECFDGLDDDGLGAVAACLEDVARDRAVIVISHRPELARLLPTVAHYDIADGRVCTLQH